MVVCGAAGWQKGRTGMRTRMTGLVGDSEGLSREVVLVVILSCLLAFESEEGKWS